MGEIERERDIGEKNRERGVGEEREGMGERVWPTDRYFPMV